MTVVTRMIYSLGLYPNQVFYYSPPYIFILSIRCVYVGSTECGRVEYDDLRADANLVSFIIHVYGSCVAYAIVLVLGLLLCIRTKNSRIELF